MKYSDITTNTLGAPSSFYQRVNDPHSDTIRLTEVSSARVHENSEEGRLPVHGIRIQQNVEVV